MSPPSDRRETVKPPRDEQWGEPVQRANAPAGVVLAVAKALFLNTPGRRQLPNERLPTEWWERIPVRVRREYISDAEVALLAAEKAREQ